MRKPLAVLDAPSNLGLRPPAPGKEPGVRALAAALRAQGLVGRLSAEDAGAVEPPPYSPSRDPVTGVRNGASIPGYSLRLADAVEPLVRRGRFPVVLGGDCSIMLGNLLALRRLGRYGLAFVDGHDDFRHPGNSGDVGAAAGEDLALATGRGAPELADLEGRRPLVAEEDVVAIGFADDGEGASDLAETEITLLELEAVKRLGPAGAADEALAVFRRRDIAGFWIHLDVDVLDGRLMPAVDSPWPEGLSFEELVALVRPLAAAELSVGLEVTIFDPDLDPDGAHARELVDALAAVLRSPQGS